MSQTKRKPRSQKTERAADQRRVRRQRQDREALQERYASRPDCPEPEPTGMYTP